MKRDRDGTEIEEPENWTDEDRKRVREQMGVDLPVLITEPGWYVTRKGLFAYVDKIKLRPSAGIMANCVGSIYTKGKAGRFEHSTWQANGRWKFLGECPKDIVSKA